MLAAPVTRVGRVEDAAEFNGIVGGLGRKPPPRPQPSWRATRRAHPGGSAVVSMIEAGSALTLAGKLA
jgi:hypothetical protein